MVQTRERERERIELSETCQTYIEGDFIEH